MDRSEHEGTFCYRTKIGLFKRARREDFHRMMVESFLNVSSYDPDESLVDSWDDCFDVLKPELCTLDGTYDNLELLFEYVLPYDDKRADVIIVGEKNVCLLEFKRASKIYDYINPEPQLKDYYRLLTTYHPAAKRMIVHSAGVYTRANQINEIGTWNNGIRFAMLSPQYVSDFIKKSFNGDMKIALNIYDWF